jgi:hypothetical protein
MNAAQDKSGMRGQYRVFSLSRDLQPEEIERLRAYASTGDAKYAEGLPIQREYEPKNVVPLVGRQALLNRLANITTYTGIVNYGALGSGSSAFSSASTQLNTEVYRKLSVGGSVSSSTAYIDWYYASTDVADGTYNEFGAFIDGTASANTGQAISLVTTGGWVKAGALFVILQLTLN